MNEVWVVSTLPAFGSRGATPDSAEQGGAADFGVKGEAGNPICALDNVGKSQC